MPLADEVKDNAKAVYTLIAEAESRVHGHPIENIHFHEVGSLDALADVLSVCELMHELAPDKVLASPVNVGSGFVKCTHGVLPVLRVEYVAYGTGKKNFETANVVRVLLGETEGECEQIIELACNLDDMTPEELGFAMEELFRLGALDVYFTSIGMKKSRSGVMLTCMAVCSSVTRCCAAYLSTRPLSVCVSMCAIGIASPAASTPSKPNMALFA